MPLWRLYYHLVWATKQRQPLITETVEQFLHAILASKSAEKGAHVFAVNGMPDHVHLVAAIPPSIAVSSFVRFVKGASSYAVQREFDLPFGWQRGYGVFSISERNLAGAIEYVRRQKEHHEANAAVPLLERTADGDEGPASVR